MHAYTRHHIATNDRAQGTASRPAGRSEVRATALPGERTGSSKPVIAGGARGAAR